MTSHWDEFSKSLAEESVPRRESLCRLGLVFAGAVLSPLGLGTAWARGSDPCKTLCNQCAKSQRSQCLAACRACASAGGQLCGGCGNVYCADLAGDPYNCGACGYVCEPPGPYEYGACIDGECRYACAEGAVYCDGTCTFLGWDPYNCGACGNACPPSAPYCNQGVCICPSGMAVCDGECIDIQNDPDNCGACGAACPTSAPYCRSGACSDRQCAPGLTWCQLTCVDLLSDNYNCGACNNQCPGGTACEAGMCVGSCEGC